MKKLAVFILLAFILSACATTKYSSPKGVRLGMTKQEVAELVGKSCKLVSAKKAPEGTYETMEYIKYEKGLNDELFVYYFFNDKLTEWHTEVLDPREGKRSRSKPDTSHRRP